MAAGRTVPATADRGGGVLRQLREATAAAHAEVEGTLDLLAPDLRLERLMAVMARLHAFWTAAEAGLDEWADRHPDDAARLRWSQRRRAPLFAADLRSLGGRPAPDPPDLPRVPGTDEALGRLYVLEGSTLGGAFIDRHLRLVPHLADVRLQALSPYGERTGAMWHAYRQATRERVAAGGDADRLVGAARATFTALAEWSRPLAASRSAG